MANKNTMDLQKLLGIIRTKYDKNIDDRILNVYQFGSRVYGTATEDSDWDFIILVSKCYPYYKLNPLQHMTEDEKKNSRLNPERYGKWEIFGDGDKINSSFIDVHDFLQEVYYNALEALQIFFVKPEHVWLEKVPIVDKGFKLDTPLFCRGVWWEINRTTRVVKNKFKSGDYARAKKNYFFRFRFMAYGIQIASRGRIYDHTEMNHILHEVQQIDHIDMQPFDEIYGPQFEELWRHFISLAPPGRFYFKRRGNQVSSMQTIKVHPPVPSDVPPPKYDQPITLQTQRFIAKMGLSKFVDEFSIKHHTHPVFPNLVFLNYDGDLNGKPPEVLEALRECNGLVLDSDNKWRVVCFPYYTIGSYNVRTCDRIELETTKVYEKLDGDLCVLYYHKGHWLVSSKDSIVGDNMLYHCNNNAPENELLRNIDKMRRKANYLFPPNKSGENAAAKFDHLKLNTNINTNSTNSNNNNNNNNNNPEEKILHQSGDHLLADTFWSVWRILNYNLPSDPTLVYMFELLVPACRHVVNNGALRLVLHGVRDLKTMQEIDHIEVGKKENWQTTEPLQVEADISKLQAGADYNNPYVSEGFVLCDKNYHRVSVKSRPHLSFSLLGFCPGINKGCPNVDAQSCTKSVLLDLVREAKDAEFVAYFPRYANEIADLREKYIKLINDATKFMNANSNLGVKEFASRANATKYASLLFSLKKRPPNKYLEYIETVPVSFMCTFMDIEDYQTFDQE